MICIIPSMHARSISSHKQESRYKQCLYSELFFSAFFPDFAAFGLNTEIYYSVRMWENPAKMRTKIAPNTDPFYEVKTDVGYLVMHVWQWSTRVGEILRGWIAREVKLAKTAIKTIEGVTSNPWK